MKPLIDGDILRYEVGFGGEWVDDSGERVIRDFEQVIELLDHKIAIICDEVEATEPPLIFMTNDKILNRMTNRKRKRKGQTPLILIPNFRDKVAVTKVYKGTRKSEKPLHFNNLSSYILENYDTHVESRGLEADDAMSIYQRQSRQATIICSRDKDLRITPGNHYSWECGRQPSRGPEEISRLGYVRLSSNGKKLEGGGLCFFYSQLLTGDTVDNVPGLQGFGPVRTARILEGAETEEDLYTRVAECYREKCGDSWGEYIREQADLLWMVQEVDSFGDPILYKFPEVEND